MHLLGDIERRHLEQRYRRRDRRGEKQEEKGDAEQVASGHVAEYVGQRDEDQFRAGRRADAVRKDGREDRQSGEDRDAGVGDGHRTGQPEHVFIFGDVRSVGDHRAHAEAQ